MTRGNRNFECVLEVVSVREPTYAKYLGHGKYRILKRSPVIAAVISHYLNYSLIMLH